MTVIRQLAILALVILGICTASFGQGGPPLIGDDPETKGDRHWEINISYPYLQTSTTTAMDTPYLDINYGLGDHIELSYQGGFLVGKTGDQGWERGYDNSLAGVKWRFLDQDANGIDMSVYPQLGFNTTSSFAKVGLAESGLSGFMPVEIAKTFGKFELDGEVGYQYYEHERDQWAGGPIVGYMVTERIELLAEARLVCDQNFRRNNFVLDAGGRVNLIDHVQLLFAAGRGVRNGGDSPHFLFYVGFGLTF